MSLYHHPPVGFADIVLGLHRHLIGEKFVALPCGNGDELCLDVDFRAEAQLFVGTVRSDDGMDQAGSGVVWFGLCERLPQLCLKFTVGIMITFGSSTSHHLMSMLVVCSSILFFIHLIHISSSGIGFETDGLSLVVSRRPSGIFCL
ncbi:hypothetical protein Tco_0921830 [Tanacetum coccineum]